MIPPFLHTKWGVGRAMAKNIRNKGRNMSSLMFKKKVLTLG